MKKSETKSGTSRREAMKMIATGSATGMMRLYGSPLLHTEAQGKMNGAAPAMFLRQDMLPTVIWTLLHGISVSRKQYHFQISCSQFFQVARQ